MTTKKPKIIGIVGGSGSGKTTLIRSIMGLLPAGGKITNGDIVFNGKSLLSYSMDDWNKIRGTELSMIFQDCGAMINPIRKIGNQFIEYIRTHEKMSKEEASKKAINMLGQMMFSNPDNIMKSYPFQLSGGMRQRVGIAMAMTFNPKLLIADEPTTALDVTIQAQILRLMNELKAETGTSIMFITHDLGVINQMADDVAVMYCGQVVETAPVDNIFMESEFIHPYTEGLLTSIPRLNSDKNKRLDAIPGSVPHPLDLPKGCKFAPRCKYATDRCKQEEPQLTAVNAKHAIRCFYPVKRGGKE